MILTSLYLYPQRKDFALEDLLYWSYEALTPEMQRRFRLTGVFAASGTFEVSAVQAIWQDQDILETHEAIKQLASVGMLKYHAGQRYTHHDFFRAYARALIPVEALYQAQAAHFAFYEARYTQYTKNLAAFALDIEADFENLREALIWGFEAETARACQLLLVELNDCYQTYYPAAYRALLEMALGVTQYGEYSYKRVQEINDLAHLHDEDEQFTSLAETQAIPRQREHRSPLCHAQILKALGDLSLRENKFAAAHEAYLQALPIYKHNNDKTGIAHVLKALGDSSIRQADYLAATTYYQNALLSYEALGDTVSQATTLTELGELSVINGQFGAARSLYHRALKLYKTDNDSLLGQGNTLYALGKLGVEEGHLEEAHHFFIDAFKIYEQLHHRIGLVNVYAHMARMYRKIGDFEQAKIHYGYALAVADTMNTHQSKIQRWRKEYELFISRLR